jgi:WD40 repeat protein
LAGHPFTGHTNFVLSVAFSPDGHHIVSGSEDQTVRVWVISTGRIVAGLHTRLIGPVAFSPVGKCIISSERGSFTY